MNVYRPQRWSLTSVDPADVSPAVEPLLTAEAKAWTNIDTTADDAIVAGLIRTGREYVEGYTNRYLIRREVTFQISEFPDREADLIELPGGTLGAVTSIAYTDEDGATQTWAATNYEVDAGRAPGRLGLAYDKDWPTDVRAWGLPITITYTAGFGDAASDVPQGLRDAVALIVADMYEHRANSMPGLSAGGTISTVPLSAKHVASRWRIPLAMRSAA